MSGTFHSAIELFFVELWREIFDYFNSNDLWYSFRGLNRKIDAIIDQTTFHFDFKKKHNYGYFVKNILPSMNVTNVRLLKLQEIPEIRQFFSIYSFNSLIELRLLSITFMYSFNDNCFTFWNQLSSLKYLRSLEIMFWDNSELDNCIEEKEFSIRLIFNNDYCPLLKSFTISTPGRQREMPTILSLIKTTKTTYIQYLSIDSLTFNDLIKLLLALQNQLYNNDNKSNEQEHNMTITMPLLPNCVRLQVKLTYDIGFEHIEYILNHTSNLKDLFLWGWYHLVNAKKWKLLLSVQCPKLIKLN